jgi:hypothetical protein
MFLSPASRARSLPRQRDQLGYQLAATVSGNGLFIALSPVPGAGSYLEFRDPTVANGDPLFRQIPNLAQFNITSGNTMGAANATAFRLWVLAFENGNGGIVLGAINCVVGGASPTQIVALDETAVQSPTGNNGGSTAGTFYAAVALTSRPFRILGFMEWSAGLAAAGSWTSKPTKIQLFGPGINRPSNPVQTVYATTSTSTTTSGSSFVDTNLSAAIVPTSAANPILAQANGNGTQTVASNGIQTTLARGATQIGSLGYAQTNTNAVTVGQLVNIAFDLPNTTASTTYKVRVQSTSAGSVTFIQSGSANMTLQELMA